MAYKAPRPLRALPRLLFLSGCLLLFCCYFIPLPFDAAGFRAVSDDMLPFLDAVRIIPFSYAVECMPYTDYYFSPLIPLFCGAALLGFSVNSAFNMPFSLRRNVRIGLIIPSSLFVFYALLRLITGAMLKRADITDIIWFALCYAAGAGMFLALSKLYALTQYKSPQQQKSSGKKEDGN